MELGRVRDNTARKRNGRERERERVLRSELVGIVHTRAVAKDSVHVGGGNLHISILSERV
jgi:hypothetical protein